MTAAEIVNDALREIRVINAVDAPSSEDAALGLFRLNKILDNLNAERRFIYADVIATYTLTPSLSPHTIGPTASTPTWIATQRPETIEAANLLIGVQRYPITIRPYEWRMGLSDPTLDSAIPTDVAYEKAWPLGKLHFYPVPSTAYSVELLTRQILASLAAQDTFTLPPGYQDLITLTLAEDLAPAMNTPLAETTVRNAQRARARVYTANGVTVPLATRDLGAPGGGDGSYYDHLTRAVR